MLITISFRKVTIVEAVTFLNPFVISLNQLKKHDMRRTEILCPDCMKGKVITSNEVNANCDQCGEEFILTGKNSLRYKKPSDLSEEQRAKSND